MRNLGLAAFYAKNAPEAARALKVAVEANPQDQRAQAMLAMSLSATQDYAGAAEAFDKLGDAAIQDPSMAYRWALALEKSNQKQRAASVLQKWTDQPLSAEMFVMAGKLYADMGDTSNAQACYAKAKAQNPSVSIPQ